MTILFFHFANSLYIRYKRGRKNQEHEKGSCQKRISIYISDAGNICELEDENRKIDAQNLV